MGRRRTPFATSGIKLGFHFGAALELSVDGEPAARPAPVQTPRPDRVSRHPAARRGVSGGVGFLFAQYLQLVAGPSPLRAAMWSLPDTAGMIVCSLLCPIVARRIRRRIGVVAAGDWRRTWRRRGAAPRHAPHR